MVMDANDKIHAIEILNRHEIVVANWRNFYNLRDYESLQRVKESIERARREITFPFMYIAEQYTIWLSSLKLGEISPAIVTEGQTARHRVDAAIRSNILRHWPELKETL